MAEVAKEFFIAEDSHYLWVRDEQRCMEVLSSTGDEPLRQCSEIILSM